MPEHTEEIRMYFIVGDWAIDAYGNVGQVLEVRPDGVVLEVMGRLSVSGARYERRFRAEELQGFPKRLTRFVMAEVRDAG